MAPLTVTFSVVDEILVADRRYDVQCHSAGSRPPALITWYRNDKKLPKIKVSYILNSINGVHYIVNSVYYMESSKH